jgi:hypothetical protein
MRRTPARTHLPSFLTESIPPGSNLSLRPYVTTTSEIPTALSFASIRLRPVYRLDAFHPSIPHSVNRWSRRLSASLSLSPSLSLSHFIPLVYTCIALLFCPSLNFSLLSDSCLLGLSSLLAPPSRPRSRLRVQPGPPRTSDERTTGVETIPQRPWLYLLLVRRRCCLFSIYLLSARPPPSTARANDHSRRTGEGAPHQASSRRASPMAISYQIAHPLVARVCLIFLQ